jgi:hypothetical protein
MYSNDNLTVSVPVVYLQNLAVLAKCKNDG